MSPEGPNHPRSETLLQEKPLWEGAEAFRNQCLQSPGPTSGDSLIQYLLSTYFISVSALDAEDSKLGKAVSLPWENYNLEREKKVVNATGNVLKGGKWCDQGTSWKY